MRPNAARCLSWSLLCVFVNCQCCTHATVETFDDQTVWQACLMNEPSVCIQLHALHEKVQEHATLIVHTVQLDGMLDHMTARVRLWYVHWYYLILNCIIERQTSAYTFIV